MPGELGGPGGRRRSPGRRPAQSAGTLEKEDELRSFLKLARPEWLVPRRKGHSDVARVMTKLRAIGVTDVDQLFKSIDHNSLNEELHSRGLVPLSKEAIDCIRKRKAFMQNLKDVSVPHIRQIGSYAPLPQMLSARCLGSPSAASSSGGGRRRRDGLGSQPGSTTMGSVESLPRAGPSIDSSNLGTLSEVATYSFDCGASVDESGPRLRGARVDLRRARRRQKAATTATTRSPSNSQSPPRSESPSGAPTVPPPRGRARGRSPSGGSEDGRGADAGEGTRRSPSATASPTAAGSSGAAGFSNERFAATTPAGFGRVTSLRSLSSRGSTSPVGTGRSRARGATSGGAAMAATDSAFSQFGGTGSASQLMSLSMGLSLSAAYPPMTDEMAMQEARTIAREGSAMTRDDKERSWGRWSCSRVKSPLQQGEEMIREQAALEEQRRLLRTVARRTGDDLAFRGHIAKNIHERLTSEAKREAGRGPALAVNQQCINIKKQLDGMTKARGELRGLRTKVQPLMEGDDEQPPLNDFGMCFAGGIFSGGDGLRRSSSSPAGAFKRSSLTSSGAPDQLGT